MGNRKILNDKGEVIMRVINVINLKGGVGKTTTTVNLAYTFAQLIGKKVLVVDNDKQGNISKFFGMFDEEEECGLSKILEGTDIRNAIKETAFEGIDIITANMKLLYSNARLAAEEEKHNKLSNFLIGIDNINSENFKEYDYVFIDSPPTIDLTVINALACADDVVVPVKLDKWAIEGLEIVKEQIEAAKEFNPAIELFGVVLTMFRKNDVNKQGEEWLRLKTEYPVMDTKIRYTEKVDESTFAGVPVVEYSKRCGAAQDYKKLAMEMMYKWEKNSI